MRRLFFIFLLAMLASPVYAAPVQDASIEKLLSLTDAKKLHDSVIADSDEIVDSTLKPMLMRENDSGTNSVCRFIFNEIQKNNQG